MKKGSALLLILHITLYISGIQAGSFSFLYWFIYSEIYSFMISGSSLRRVGYEGEAPVCSVHMGGCDKWKRAVTSWDEWRTLGGGDMPGPWLWLIGNINTVPLECIQSSFIYSVKRKAEQKQRWAERGEIGQFCMNTNRGGVWKGQAERRLVAGREPQRRPLH